MRYTVPVDAPSEVEALVAAGADELYCGYQDAWWIERYGDHDSATRRQGRANISSRDELAQTAAAARDAGVPLYLALNARYTEPQLDYLKTLCDDFAFMGGTGIIASDLGLLWRMRGNPRLRRTLSLLAVAQNMPTLAAYRGLGVTRVILPRFIGPDEAGKLMAAVPRMEGEVMAFFDKCPMVDGYCRHRHGVGYADRSVPGGTDDAAPLYTFDTIYRTHACLGTSCDYLDPYPCAACTLPQFSDAGIGFAKLGGRGRPLEERLRALRFLHLAEELPDDGARRELYRQTFGADCACYYGDALQDRSAIQPIAHPDQPGRLYVGSQTDTGEFERALADVAQGLHASSAERITLLVPPLSNESLKTLLLALPALAKQGPAGMRLCVNDLGTLLLLVSEKREQSLPFELSFGALLARLDDPAEIAHFLSAEENPSRAIWDTCGEPRMLMYRQPPETLVEHWRRPSLCEPSAQAALRALTGGMDITYEFASEHDA